MIQTHTHTHTHNTYIEKKYGEKYLNYRLIKTELENNSYGWLAENKTLSFTLSVTVEC